MPRPALVTEKQQKQIVDRYKKGRKLRDIEEEFGITRSQVYWVLQQQKVAPSRTKPKSRLDDGNEQTTARLYEILEAQDKRIQELEEFLVMVEASIAGDQEIIEGVFDKDVIVARRKKLLDTIHELLSE